MPYNILYNLSSLCVYPQSSNFCSLKSSLVEQLHETLGMEGVGSYYFADIESKLDVQKLADLPSYRLCEVVS